MKSFIALFLVLSPGAAWAIRNATPGEQENIQKVIDAVTKAGDEIIAQVKKRKEAEAEQKPTDEFDNKIAELLAQRKHLGNKAIWLTVNAYELLLPGPGFLQGKIYAEGVNKGNIVTWLPKFDEHLEKNTIDEKGRKGKSSFPGAQGVTATDGVSYIFPEAFENPTFLASTIYHERLHLEQLTTKGIGDRFTTGELELATLNAEAQLLEKNILKYPDAAEETRQKERLNRKIVKTAHKADKERAAHKPGEPIQLEDIQSHTRKELSEIQDGAKQLRKQIIRESAQDLLHNAARAMCKGPLGAGLGVGARDYQLGCDAFPDDKPWLIDDPLIKEMGGCQKEAMQRLIRCGDKDRVAAEIDEMRRRRFDDAVERFWRTAPRICSGRGSALDLTDFRAACYQLPAMPPDELAGRVKARGVTRCAGEIVDVLVASCENDDEEVGRKVREILSRNPPPAAVPVLSPGESRAADAEALRRLWQKMAGIADALCDDPSRASEKYDEFCAARRQEKEIEDAYLRKGANPPRDKWSEVHNSRCGWEFWSEMLNHQERMCFGENSATEAAYATWFRDTASRLYRKEHSPAEPVGPAPSPTPPPRPNPRNPGTGGGGWSPKQACERHGGRWSGSVCLKDPDP